MWCQSYFFLQAEDGIRDLVRSRGLGDVYKRQGLCPAERRQILPPLRRRLHQALDDAGVEEGHGVPLSLIHI